MRRCTPHAPSNQCVLVRFGVRPSTTHLLTDPPLQKIGVVSVQIFPGSRLPPRERRGGQPKAVMGIVMKIQLTTPFGISRPLDQGKCGRGFLGLLPGGLEISHSEK